MKQKITFLTAYGTYTYIHTYMETPITVRCIYYLWAISALSWRRLHLLGAQEFKKKKKTRSYSPTFPYRVLSAQLVSSQGHGDKEKHPNTRHLPIIDSRTNPSAVMLLLLAAVAAKLLLLLRCCCCCQVAAAAIQLLRNCDLDLGTFVSTASRCLFLVLFVCLFLCLFVSLFVCWFACSVVCLLADCYRLFFFCFVARVVQNFDSVWRSDFGAAALT